MARHIIQIEEGFQYVGNSIRWRMYATKDRVFLYDDGDAVVDIPFKIGDVVVVNCSGANTSATKLTPPKNKVAKLFWSYGFNRGTRESAEPIEAARHPEDTVNRILKYYFGGPTSHHKLGYEEGVYLFVTGRCYASNKCVTAWWVKENPTNEELDRIELALSEKYDKVWYAE